MARKIWVGVVVILLAFSGWAYYAPYLAVKGMRAAAESKDAVALTRYVNFPSLRESLKATFNAKLISQMSKKQEGNPFAALGAALAIAFVGPMVDAMVTPESLAMMMKGEKPSLGKGEATATPTPVSAVTQAELETSMGYESFDQFAVSTKKKGVQADPAVLIFQREGLLSWKLVAIRFP